MNPKNFVFSNGWHWEFDSLTSIWILKDEKNRTLTTMSLGDGMIIYCHTNPETREFATNEF